jgi:hypothetical protein
MFETGGDHPEDGRTEQRSISARVDQQGAVRWPLKMLKRKLDSY